MKTLLLLITINLFGLTVSAQAYEGEIQFDKKKQPAIVIEYRYPAEAVENAFIARLERMGYKVKEEKGILNRDKGFLVFKNAYLTDMSPTRLDYIVKVERKSRKDEDESTLYLVLQKDGENAMNTLQAADIGQVKLYLNQMIPDIEAANLELQIKAQEELISKTEKKLKNLQEDKADLERKLANNEKEQDQTIRDIQDQRQQLGNLQGKRKQ